MAENTPVTLTPRLKMLANEVKKGAILADIGTDHAHLPIFLIQNGIIKSAIASDIRQGPLDRAMQNVKKYGYDDLISLRLGAGLEKVKVGECDTITIAGMGGETIIDILTAAKWTNSDEYTLVLQPMTMIYQLRQWLYANGYEIQKENVCSEEHRRYVVMVVKGGGEKHCVSLYECAVSPALLKAEGAADYIKYVLNKEKKALLGLEKAKETDINRLELQKNIVNTLEKGLEAIK